MNVETCTLYFAGTARGPEKDRMSTQAYYKERLGFDPADTVAEHQREQRSQHGYEESLSKFKGQNANGFPEESPGCNGVVGEHRAGNTQAFWGCWAMFIEAHDERDAIQKKTFTKWVNKHLKKASRHVGDLFEDLRDGHNLISLLEVLSGEHLPRERGRMRFHMLQNVQMALDFLRYKKIKLVNIRAEDIVDGNPKLTLGLIWTIILHFQISDIVVGQEPNVTAREALLRWARRSTARYPGVRVTDFTGSWRDGLAFSALLHRNRPDLVDWRSARSSQPRERLDRVFYVAEREYGVTRLLDPEDVDTPEPDEKSLITYISSLYDVFPEPPAIHPLYDAEAQRRSAEYRELASSLHMWIREKMVLMQERSFPPTLIEMKKLAADSAKFKNEEVPPRYRDKQRLTYIFRDLQKYFEAVGEVDMEPELHIEVIDKNWNRLIMLHQEREQSIIDEIKRLERLQRLAEKVHREMKTTDNRLEELERRVEDEARKLDRLHPLEAKHAVDLLEQDIRSTETQIQNIFTDVHTLTEGRYSQAPELHKRVQKLHQRWVVLRSLLHRRLVQPLSVVSFPVEERVVTKHRTTVHETRLVDTNPYFRALHDCIDWCKSKLKHLQEADYGSDLPSVQNELDVHQREHKNIDQFQAKVDKCVQAKNNFHGEELTLYSQHLGTLQKLYAELLAISNKRLSDLDTLHDFIQSATGELVWLNAKEETEVTRDWSDKNLNVQSIEQYYESLMSDLEKREIQFSAVQDRGEALILQHHPAAKTIEAYMSAMQTQWAWLLQLTLCLEVHLRHAAQNQQFFKDIQQTEQLISKHDETLNTIYSQSDFSLDEGERLLKGMQELREELNNCHIHVQRLVERAKDIVPMKQRKQPVVRPLQVTCICNYKQVNMSIEKGEQCTLYDNSGRVKWRVKNTQGVESPVPGVCFALQPPDKEALDAAERLRRQYDRSIALWQRKELRLRQNMIFATIKVVKGWDLPQFLAMGQDQRTVIRNALNEDANKLLSEGDPADPQLRRLKREMADVNRLFDDFEKRARAEEESKNAGRIFNEQASSLQQALDEAERILNTRIAAPLPRDLDSLEYLVLQHKDYEQHLQRLAPDVEEIQQTFRGITLKTPAMRNKLDNITTKWKHLWNLHNLYIERLKCIEIVLSSLEENTTAISDFEIKLASFGELPSDIKGLQIVLEDLMVLQNAIAHQQVSIDQLNEDAHNARRLVEKSRPNHRGPHGDMDRLDAEVNKLNARWTNVCGQLVDRLRSAETAYGLAQQYQNSYQNEVDFVDESYGKLELENTKIYGQRLRAFKEQLEDICPSLDASVKRPRRDSVITVDNVARDLDTLNRRYTTLVNLLEERIKQLALLHPEDISLQRVLQEQRPLRTFRTEFNIYESTTSEERYTSTTTHYTQSQYTSERHESTETTFSSETSKRIYSPEQPAYRPNGETTSPEAVSPIGGSLLKRSYESETTSSSRRQQQQQDFSSVVDSGGFSSELRDLRRVPRVDDGGVIGAENVIDVRGIVDPSSGEVLTVGEAIRLRILDVRNGRIVTSSDGRTSVSIEEAARDGIIDIALANRLLGPCGVKSEEGRRVSLLEAIQRELCDAERADIADRVKVTTVRGDNGAGSGAVAGVSVVDAMKQGLLDPATGEVVVENGERISIEEAYSRGYLTKVDVTVRVSRNAIALSDAISQGLVDDRSGRVVDRITGESYPLDEAIDKGIVDPKVREIVDTRDDIKVTVAEAMKRGILNAKSGRYMHGLSMEKLPFKEARRRQLIVKPMTLKDCCDLEIIDDKSKIVSPAHRSKLTILEAISRGVLDSENIKSIVDTRTGEMMTLADALANGIIKVEGTYRDMLKAEELPIAQAVEKGLITSVTQKTIFDIDGFKDPVSGEYISLNAALLKGLISSKSGGTFTIDLKTGKTVSLSEAEEEGYIRPEVLEMLNRGIGIIENGREVSVLEAVLFGLLDPKSGQLLDPRSKRTVPLEEAIKRGLITPDGAALLTSMLNIAVTTQTVTKTIRKYVTTLHTGEVVTRDYKMSYEEALNSGLIDEDTNKFKDPDSGVTMSIEDAIEQSLLGSDDHQHVMYSSRERTPDSAHTTFESTLTTSIDDISKRSESPPRAIGTVTTIITKEITPPASSTPKKELSSVTMTIAPSTDSVSSVTDSLASKTGKTTSSTTTNEATKSRTSEITSKTTSFEETHVVSHTDTPKSPLFDEKGDMETKVIASTTPTTSYKSEIMKFIESERAFTDKRVFELPTDGWTLAEAIDRRLFDPATGLFIIPGTDRLVSFEECIKLQIINPNSGFVIDPNNGRKVSLVRSLEKNILDSTGHYSYPQKISMREAIANGLIILEDELSADNDNANQRLLQITRVSGQPDIVELTHIGDPSQQTEIKISDEVSLPDPVQVTQGVIYDPGTALVISTKTGKSANLLAAVSEGTIPSTAVIVKDPITGKDISMADAVNRGILDINTREYKIDGGRKISLLDATKFGVISVLGAPLAATAAAIEAVQRTMVKDPVTGKKIPREVAIERGIIPMHDNATSPIIESASGTPDGGNEKIVAQVTIHDEPEKVYVPKEDSKSAAFTDSSTSINDVPDGESLGTKTRARVTVEPRYQVTIGKARTISQSPEREAKPIVLQKMRKKIVKVEEALQSGLIDVETADTFSKKICNEKGESITLSEAIRDNQINADQGQIIDPQRGDVLTIKQAVDRGILDPENAHILVPLAKSLSVHSLYTQGLLDPLEGKIVHPETGAHLTLNEAIVCEIVDPLSNLIFTVDGRTETLQSAIANDTIDADRLLVKTQGGSVNLVKAIENKVFELEEPIESSDIPPAGMTFPVALKRGLIDMSKKEVRHPITGEHLPLEDAIKGDFIMALPYPMAPDSIEITKALELGLIDKDNAIFFHPTTGTPIPIAEAVESGLLIIKPPVCGENTVAAITETITSYHTITTKTVELLPGYALKSAMEVQDINTGNIITITEARQRGIIKDESESKEEFTTKDIKMSFDHAVEKGFVDMKKGIYTDPCTGTTMPIAKAVEEGILDTSSSKSEFVSPGKSNNSLTVLEAVEQIYDEETGTFKDPETNESYNLREAMEVGLIEPDSVLYNVKTKETITTKEAVEKGLLDPATGKMKTMRDQKNRPISIAEATKMGLLAVIAAPVLAGKAVVDAISSRKSKETKPSVHVTAKSSVAHTAKKEPSTEIVSTQIQVSQRPFRTDSHESEALISQEKSNAAVTQEHSSAQREESLYAEQIEIEDMEIEDDSKLTTITDEDIPKQVSIIITKELTPQILAKFGVFDPVREKFLDPETGTVTSFNDLVLNLKVFDPDRVLVKNLSSKTDTYVKLREAISRPLIDRNVAYMVDPKTGKKIPFFEAVRLEWIKEELEDEAEKESQPLSLQEAIDIGMCNPITGTIQDPKSGQELSMSEAIDMGLVDPELLSVRNPITEEIMPLSEALETEALDLHKGAVINMETKTEIDVVTSAFLRGLIVPTSRKPISLEAVIRKGLYDTETGKIQDLFTKQPIDVEESVRRGIVDAFITEIEDTKAGSSVSLDDALTMNLILSTGRLCDTRAGELLPLDVALNKGLIITTPFVLSLIDAIVQEYYLPKTGLVLNPMTGDNLTLKEALAIGYVNGSTTVIKDDRKDQVISLNEAEECKLIDLVRGTLIYPHSMTLDIAFEKGYILSTVKPWTLQEALALQVYDPKTGSFNIDGNNYTLEEMIEKSFISKDSPSIKDPRNNDIISLGDAIKHGFVNAKTGTAIDPCTSVPLSLTDALDRGFIVPAKRKISLPDAVFKGLYDPKTGQFTVPDTQEKLPTDRAIKMGVIDTTTAIVRDPNGDVMTFNKAIKASVVDPKSGTVSHARGPPVDFQEALERGLLLETRRPMSFSEAISKGILDEKTNKFLDPQTGIYLTILEAIQKNLIDADSVTVKDTRSSIWKTMTLMEAIHLGYVDGTTGYLKDPSKSNRNVSLRDAFESGLIVDSRAAVSLQRTIHQGLYDDNTGKITDPSTGRTVTLHEAMRKCIISPTLPCYWDKRGERLLSLAETCRAGVIDRRTGMFKELGASGSVSLSVALQLGLIVDIESMGFGLYEALLMNMYDVSSGKFVHPTNNRKLTLAESCQMDLINPLTSIVKCTKSNRYIPLAEAISAGIIDDIRGMYVIRELDKAINLQEARKKGFIVTSKMPLSIEEAVKCCLYRGDSGKFADPIANEYHDLLQAINCGLVDPDTTALKDATTGQIKSLLAGIEDGTVDVSRGRILDPKTTRAFNVDVALERGLLVTIDKPLAQQMAHRSPLEVSKAGPGDRSVKECTLEEAINFELIDPNTSVVRDPRTGRFVTTTRAIADGIVNPSVKGTIELNGGGKREPRFVRFGDVTVFVRKPLTFEEAIEKEYLSLESGKFTDPISNEQLTLKEAVSLGIVDSDSALIKDSQKKKLVKLPEAFRKGMMDAEKANVLDTATSKLYSLSKALEIGLLITPRNGVSFIEALQFGLYNPTTGGFYDPFVVTSVLDRRRLTLAHAIESGLIDPSTTVIKDPFTGNIESLLETVNSGKVDSVGGRLIEDTDGKSIDFVKALERGYILAAEAR
ncbi:bullous pemphigoid antigen isoforms 6 9 10, partial [Lasius niger]